MSTTTLEPYAVVAYNSAWDSENKIHDDEVARRFGFSGGLVPGVDVYAYMAHAPVTRWGRDFLARGTLEARFLKPVYEGETATVTAKEANGGLDIEVTSRGELCATGHAAMTGTKPPALDAFAAVARRRGALPGRRGLAAGWPRARHPPARHHEGMGGQVRRRRARARPALWARGPVASGPAAAPFQLGAHPQRRAGTVDPRRQQGRPLRRRQGRRRADGARQGSGQLREEGPPLRRPRRPRHRQRHHPHRPHLPHRHLPPARRCRSGWRVSA